MEKSQISRHHAIASEEPLHDPLSLLVFRLNEWMRSFGCLFVFSFQISYLFINSFLARLNPIRLFLLPRLTGGRRSCAAKSTFAPSVSCSISMRWLNLFYLFHLRTILNISWVIIINHSVSYYMAFTAFAVI